MQQLSYDPNLPWVEASGFRMSAQLITFENVYALDPGSLTVERNGGHTVARSSALTWAGGQERCDGALSIAAAPIDVGLEITLSARHERTIRCVKLLVGGLPAGDLIGNWWRRASLPKGGTILAYPYLHTPLVFLAPPAEPHVYLHSLDDRVRAKRFAFYEDAGSITAELIFEQAAHEMSNTVETPPWRIGRCDDPTTIVSRHIEHVEGAFGLEPWESRKDVPSWAREIALVVALHGMHWSGHVFNTYDSMLTVLRWIAERIEGRRLLAFLPGWEGRYYWQYGDYRPEPRLGGDDGFGRLADGARELGVKLMPMFGMNCANTGLTNFEQWGAPAMMRSAAGLVMQGNRPDWDTARAHDPGWQAWLNPGAPAWRSRLLDQVSRLVERYELPAVFFDTHHVWLNDPSHPVYEGMLALRDSLKARFPDLLIAGEGWYDALGAITPVSQVGAPECWPEIFAKHCRTFLHLSAGDPSRDSTGVHELGRNSFRLAPDAPYCWPTLTVVDGTIERVPDRVEEVLAQARRYADRYLV